MAGITGRRFRISPVQMDSFQVIFFFQIEMPMNDDSFVIFFRNERKQTFRIDRRSVGLTQMKDIKPLIRILSSSTKYVGVVISINFM